MTHEELKRKVLALIEEINQDNPNLTDDPDIAAKYNCVVNQRMFEMARIKKIAKYKEMPVKKGDLLTLEKIGNAFGYEIYQIDKIAGVRHDPKANGTIFKILEDGIAEIEAYVFPEPITENTSGSYEFELSVDALEVMIFGIAADLLKSDKSAEYGNVYALEFEKKLNRLDPRNQMGMIIIEGGVDL